jgi:predicted nucleotidyltransferase
MPVVPLNPEQVAIARDQIEQLGVVPTFESVSGSHLYGLAHADSDLDWRAIYEPTVEELVSLRGVTETYNTVTPECDVNVTTLGRWIQHIANGSPQHHEMLWRPDAWANRHPFIDHLYEIRGTLLTRKMTGSFRSAAFGSWKKMEKGAEKTGEWEGKDARHAFRLLATAEDIVNDREINPVADREKLFQIAEDVQDEKLRRALNDEFHGRIAALNEKLTTTDMPDVLDMESLNDDYVSWLMSNHS